VVLFFLFLIFVYNRKLNIAYKACPMGNLKIEAKEEEKK